jgi:hypothetical protein
MTLRPIVTAASVTTGMLTALLLLPAASAHADGKVTWKSNATSQYLEVYKSSKSQGGIVGNYPWNGTKTQYWLDSRLSGPYWREKNYNSKLSLTAYNTCSQGITQWKWHSSWTTNEWKELKIGSGKYLLINHAGCDGNPYHDEIVPDPVYYNVYLRTDSNTHGMNPYWH